MTLTPEAIFGLLAVVIMLFPTGLYVVRWLRRCYYYRNGGIATIEPRCGMPALARPPPFAHHQAFHDIEMQLQYGCPRQLCDGVRSQVCCSESRTNCFI
jgi:hypothetical protein